MQLSVTGKGGKVIQVLLPAVVSRALLALAMVSQWVRQPICYRAAGCVVHRGLQWVLACENSGAAEARRIIFLDILPNFTLSHEPAVGS